MDGSVLESSLLGLCILMTLAIGLLFVFFMVVLQFADLGQACAVSFCGRLPLSRVFLLAVVLFGPLHLLGSLCKHYLALDRMVF